MEQTQTTVDTEQTSLAVVEKVAEVEGVSPDTLTPPLYETIDPDALDALVRNRGFTGEVKFTYHDNRVLVDSDGHITVKPQ